MKTFRIDNRDFKPGEVIHPQNAYVSKLDEARKAVEDILEKNRPTGKPGRNTILMLFQEFNDAKHHWTLQKNSRFYRTEILESAVLHIGDYNKVELLFRHLSGVEKSDMVKADRIAFEYWNGEMSDKPKKEIFVKEATVAEIKSNSEEERRNAFAIRAGLGNPRIRVLTDN